MVTSPNLTLPNFTWPNHTLPKLTIIDQSFDLLFNYKIFIGRERVNSSKNISSNSADFGKTT